MRRQDKRARRLMRLRQLMCVLAGLMAINAGALTLLRGNLHYQNYVYAWVFDPFALVVGAVFIAFAIRLGKHE